MWNQDHQWLLTTAHLSHYHVECMLPTLMVIKLSLVTRCGPNPKRSKMVHKQANHVLSNQRRIQCMCYGTSKSISFRSDPIHVLEIWLKKYTSNKFRTHYINWDMLESRTQTHRVQILNLPCLIEDSCEKDVKEVKMRSKDIAEEQSMRSQVRKPIFQFWLCKLQDNFSLSRERERHPIPKNLILILP